MKSIKALASKMSEGDVVQISYSLGHRVALVYMGGQVVLTKTTVSIDGEESVSSTVVR